MPRDPAASLTAYYTDAGYPPGTWWGAGLDGVGADGARLATGDAVAEEEMARLFGAGRDPVTDAPLGRPYTLFRDTNQRIADAIAALPPGLDDGPRAAAIDAITRTESSRRTRSAVAGFDFTFTAPKSASVLWAVSDPATQAVIVAAHRDAVRDALALVEDRALFTRVGARSCAQVSTRGMIAAVFDHWDTRTGDPNLHSHVVIANKVQGLDGLWRSLDSRALHHAAVAVSEVYDNLVADRLAAELPVSWSHRDRGPRRTPGFEIDGVPDLLLAEFSSRSAAITHAVATAVAEFQDLHGRAPSRVETTRLRQRATLRTRPAKTVHPLPGLMAWWRERAADLLHRLPDPALGPLLPVLVALRLAADGRAEVRRRAGIGPSSPAAGVVHVRHQETDRPSPSSVPPARVRGLATVRPSPASRPSESVHRLFDGDDDGRARSRLWASTEVPDVVIEQLATTVVAGVMQRRSTWTRWNLLAETARATRALRCVSVADRHALHDRVVAAAVQACVCLEAPELFTVPAAFRRPDGVAVFTRPGQDTYTHTTVLEAEQRLLAALDDLTAPTADVEVALRVTRGPQPPRRASGVPVWLATDQVAAVVDVATSGRRLDVLVGPAGTGKTTTLRALRTVWEDRHGPGSVAGLAPSAAAARELADALGIPCENTAKWLHETTGPAGARRAQERAHLQDLAEHALRHGDGLAHRRITVGLHDLEAQSSTWALRAGQLLIVDEASLAGTFTLDTLTAQASAAGAKVLLVGDHQQLSAVDAGGAFGLLAACEPARELRSLWRFTQRWEAHTTRRLRHGDPAVISAYSEHDRITAASADQVLDAAYDAWTSHLAGGATALLLAADTATVDALNERAHLDRIAAGQIDPATEVPAAAGARVGVGDLVLTRHNDRRLLTTSSEHVRNGDRWTVTATHADGSITATRHTAPTAVNAPRPVTGVDAPEKVDLPAAYVVEHVELGYAATIHRAQGVTVDHAHVLVTPGMSREALYVGLTRGAGSNHLYVALDDGTDPAHDTIPDPGRPEPTAADILAGVLATSSRERSATETLRERQDAATAPGRLLPIRDTLLTGTPWLAPDDRLPLPAATPPEIEEAVAEIDALLHHRSALTVEVDDAPRWAEPGSLEVPETAELEAQLAAMPEPWQAIAR